MPGMKRFAMLLMIGLLSVVSSDVIATHVSQKSSVVNNTVANTQTKKIALSTLDPAIIYSLIRYPKFYGDPNTTQGNLAERSYLTGSLGGLRNTLYEHGILLDVSGTQFLAENFSGGYDHGKARYDGTADYWLSLDTGKAGLWSAGLFMVHAETSWQANKSINPDVGSLVPANFDAVMPVPNESITLVSEYYYVQALPANIAILAGKVDFAGLADQNTFANNERDQFIYTGLVNNPILGAFIPYTTLGVAMTWMPNTENSVALVLADKDGNVKTSGFNTVFDGNNSLGLQYQYSPVVSDRLPGDYRIIFGGTNKKTVSFAIDPRQLVAEVIGIVPAAFKPNNYAILFNFDQYLWVKGGSAAAYEKSVNESGVPGIARHNLPPEGIGIFARAGFAPKDRNVIDQFYSVGVGGYGMIIPSREDDQWGLGYAGTHISSDLRNSVSLITRRIQSFEHAFEVFYNFQIIPSVHLTINAQAIKPPLGTRTTAFAAGTRLQVDL